jgi:hypothetical protein
MAEEKADTRESTWRNLFPWTELFRCFKVAVDPNKLLLAAAGLFSMAVGWWLLAVLFGAGEGPSAPQPGSSAYQGKDWKTYKDARDSWNLMHEATNCGGDQQKYEIEDLAENADEYERLKAAKQMYDDKLPKKVDGKDPPPLPEKERHELFEKALLANGFLPERAVGMAATFGETKLHGRLATWPWFEDRGPNPYLMVTRQTGPLWSPGHFWDWFTGSEMPVIFEPLIKIVRPIVYFFSPRSNAYTKFYFLCVTIWTMAVWSVFGGAITRIAAVEVARGEKIGLGEAIRFTTRRWLAYLSAPLFPLLFVFFLLVLMWIFGLFFWIPFVGDILVAGLLWWVPLLFGLGMACTLIGLAVGWPLMAPTISTEDTDSWEAVSRSFSYVFQRPWHYIWYSVVGASYGAVAVFFIGFVASFAVYLAKMGVGTTPFVRDPSFLFAYSPTSFEWRTLLLQGAKADDENVVQDGKLSPKIYEKYIDSNRPGGLWTYNKIGGFLVAVWLGVAFLMLIGFGYSFFFSMSTIIYLLMRRHVDSAELDEVHLEEDEPEAAPGGFPAAPTPPAAPPAKPTPGLTMVESPTLRPPAPPPAPTPPPPTLPAPTPPPPVAAAPPAETTNPMTAKTEPIPKDDEKTTMDPK